MQRQLATLELSICEMGINHFVFRDTVSAGVSMKTIVGSFALFSSLAIAGLRLGVDESDDLSQADEALMTCNGWHGSHADIGHKHHRHHHGHGQGHGGIGGQPHATGMGGAGGSMAGTTGTAGTTGMAGRPAWQARPAPQARPAWAVRAAIRAARPSTVSVAWRRRLRRFRRRERRQRLGGFAAGIDSQLDLTGAIGAYVEVPHSADLMMSGAITIDASISEPALGGRIVDKAQAFGSNGYLLDIIGDKLRMFIGTDALVESDPVPSGMFVHVAGVFNGSGLGVYINGALSAESVPQPSPTPCRCTSARIRTATASSSA